MSTYVWNSFTKNDAGNINPFGFNGTGFTPGALSAPTSDAKLVRCAAGMYYSLANRNTSVLITPDWPALTMGYMCVDVQPAGSSVVPSPTDPNPVGRKIRSLLRTSYTSFGFSTSQGISTMQTDGLVWSQGEDRTPTGSGLQIRMSFVLENLASGPSIFGSSASWGYTAQMHALWLVP